MECKAKTEVSAVTDLGVTLRTALLAAPQPPLDTGLAEQVPAAQRGDTVLPRVGPRLETDGADLAVVWTRRAQVRAGQEPCTGGSGVP